MPRQYEGMRKTFKWNLNDEEAGKTYPHLRHVYDKVRIAKLYKSKIPYGDINTIPKNFPVILKPRYSKLSLTKNDFSALILKSAALSFKFL